MKKVVIDKSRSGFNLSAEAIKYFLNLKGRTIFFYKRLGDEFIEVSSFNSEETIYCLTEHLGKTTRTIPHKILFDVDSIDREDPFLIKTVEDLGEKADTNDTQLKTVKIPFQKYDIIIHNGRETVIAPIITYG